jgi:hypothetical protein
MMTAAPLGALAEVILEQYGELIEAAIADAVRKRAPLSPRDRVAMPEPKLERFRSEELAEMHIQPGNWVAVGRIGDIQSSVMIEINLSTWEWREACEASPFQDSMIPAVDESSVLPPSARQAAS